MMDVLSKTLAHEGVRGLYKVGVMVMWAFPQTRLGWRSTRWARCCTTQFGPGRVRSARGGGASALVLGTPVPALACGRAGSQQPAFRVHVGAGVCRKGRVSACCSSDRPWVLQGGRGEEVGKAPTLNCWFLRGGVQMATCDRASTPSPSWPGTGGLLQPCPPPCAP